MLYADQKTYMVELLMKQDQMSMACSIESRVPFLDHPLVEFAARVPDHLKIHKGIGKYIVGQVKRSRIYSQRNCCIVRRWVSRRRCVLGCSNRAACICSIRSPTPTVFSRHTRIAPRSKALWHGIAVGRKTQPTGCGYRS